MNSASENGSESDRFQDRLHVTMVDSIDSFNRPKLPKSALLSIISMMYCIKLWLWIDSLKIVHNYDVPNRSPTSSAKRFADISAKI